LSLLQDYYPYFHPAPWKDIAIITTSPSKCERAQRASQNVASTWECLFGNSSSNQGNANTESLCVAQGGIWTERKPLGGGAPACVISNNQSFFDWSVPVLGVDVDSCVLRIRWNVT
jgi:hypothetical protein